MHLSHKLMKLFLFLVIALVVAVAFAQDSSAGNADITGIYRDNKNELEYHIRQVNELVWLFALPMANETAGADQNSSMEDKRLVFQGVYSATGATGSSGSANATVYDAFIVGSWSLVPVKEGENLSATDNGILVWGLKDNELHIIEDTNFKNLFDINMLSKAS